jgi:hypothetical protein
MNYQFNYSNTEKTKWKVGRDAITKIKHPGMVPLEVGT